jgi:redox-sensing transcriptional repressor
MAPPTRIPKPTARRLSRYLRLLQSRKAAGDGSHVSSRELAEAAGVVDAQVRKDLATVGAVGHPGVGFRSADLLDRLRSAMGLERRWSVALVGAGKIGRALLAYPRFTEEGFEIVAVFDRSPQVSGRKVAGHVVQPMSALAEGVRRSGAELGIVAVPPDEAQAVAEALVKAGIGGILNFAPRPLRLAAGVAVVPVDFTEALERLAFEITDRKSGTTGRARGG